MAPLGTFNRQWDTMTAAVSGFGLESAKLSQAQKALETYVVTVDRLRGSGDREAMRTGMQDARKALSDSMKAVLTEAQFAKFQPTMGGGRGMAPGGGRPPEGGGPDKKDDK
jgi:hypothetical protein